jgi:hypothetical protein
MLDVLEWVKKRTEPKADAEADTENDPAAGFLSGLRGADPDTTLNQLSGWLSPKTYVAEADPKATSDILARIDDAGAAHVTALLTQYLASPEGKQAARESTWKSLLRYQSSLTQGLCASAEVLTTAAMSERSLRPQAAVSATRALSACRRLAKICLVHYASVPGSLWRLAYSVHAHAEKAGCAMFPAKAHADQRTIVTAEQELLRLLMLQASAPDMMAPDHIEVADRVIEQLGSQFTLRAPGVADNPFCFDPGGDAPPQRASEASAPGGALRFFGPGAGFDALEKICKELSATRVDRIQYFGPDIPPNAQLSAVHHLQMFWRAKSPYTPPAHTSATGNVQVLHRYAQIWKQLSGSGSGKRELAFADAVDSAPPAPEDWVLRDAGGNELGAEIPQAGGDWAKCGEMVGLTMQDGGECWIGMIRRMRAEPGELRRADIAVLSRMPQAVPLRAVHELGDGSVVSDAASRQFNHDEVQAIILADGAAGSPPPNLLLPPEAWKEGRVFEAKIGTEPRFVRGLQAVRRGTDYVRATFEWVSGPQG